MRPAIVREAPIPAGTVFWFWGRPLRVVKSFGASKSSAVIVEEMAPDDHRTLPGQYGLWCHDAVRRILADGGISAFPLKRTA